MSDFYVALIETNSDGEYFVTVPDLPGVNASGTTRGEALALAIEFANDYVRDLMEEGHAVPQPREIDLIEADPDVTEVGRALLPVEMPGKSIKISISIDAALLARSDRAATAEGMTRSAYIASALNARMRMMVPVPIESSRSGDSDGWVEIKDMIENATTRTQSGPVLVVPIGGQGNKNLFQRISDAFGPAGGAGKVTNVRARSATTGQVETVRASSGGSSKKVTAAVSPKRA